MNYSHYYLKMGLKYQKYTKRFNIIKLTNIIKFLIKKYENLQNKLQKMQLQEY